MTRENWLGLMAALRRGETMGISNLEATAILRELEETGIDFLHVDPPAPPAPKPVVYERAR